MAPYYYPSLSVSAGRPDRLVKNKVGSGGIHSTMSFRLAVSPKWYANEFSQHVTAGLFHLSTKDWDLHAELTLLLYFFAHIRKLPAASPFIFFPFFFPFLPISHRLQSFRGRSNYPLQIRVYSQIPSVLEPLIVYLWTLIYHENHSHSRAAAQPFYIPASFCVWVGIETLGECKLEASLSFQTLTCFRWWLIIQLHNICEVIASIKWITLISNPNPLNDSKEH